MKKIARIALALSFVFFFVSFSNAQTSADWMRVTSDNAEFSAEVPAKYNFFYDKEGFTFFDDSPRNYTPTEDFSKTFFLKNFHIFSSFQEKTLISFECYKVGKIGADRFLVIDKQKMKVSEENHGTYKFKQIINKEAGYYFIRRYYSSKNYLYIATAASREGETAALKHFLDSIVFDPKISASGEDKTNFSKLKISELSVSVKEDVNYKPTTLNSAAAASDSNIKEVLFINKPLALSSRMARQKNIWTDVAMKVTLNENGFIPEITIIKPMPEALIRQSIFSTLRMRFLPEEKNGVAQATTKTIEYPF